VKTINIRGDKPVTGVKISSRKATIQLWKMPMAAIARATRTEMMISMIIPRHMAGDI
jgi:hypothetical protein